MKTRTFCFSLVLATVFSLIPGWVLAAKVGDKPSNQQTLNKPIQVDTTKLTKPPANNLPAVKELTSRRWMSKPQHGDRTSYPK